jgi:hypothetical protein
VEAVLGVVETAQQADADIRTRARELVDQGAPIGCGRIVVLADQLEEAQRINVEHHRGGEATNPTAAA